MQMRKEYSKFIGIIGILLIIASWVINAAFRHKIASVIIYIIFGLGVLSVLISIILGHKWIVAFLKKRKVQKAFSSIGIMIIIMGILISLYWLAKNYSKRIDITEDKLYTLSMQTTKLLKNLKLPILITVWSEENNVESDILELLKFYQQENKDKILIRYLDPYKHPLLFQNFSLQRDRGEGSIVLERLNFANSIDLNEIERQIPHSFDNSRKEHILKVLKNAYVKRGTNYYLSSNIYKNKQILIDFTDVLKFISKPLKNRIIYREDFKKASYDKKIGRDTSQFNFLGETKLTSAINSLENSKKLNIYVTKNHGEKGFFDNKDFGYSKIKDNLILENYNVKEIDLTIKDIPIDCNALIIAGPKQSFKQIEINKIGSYLARGGHSLFLLDPEIQYSNIRNPINLGFDQLLSDFGIKLNNALIVDIENSRKMPIEKASGPFIFKDEIHVHMGKYGSHEIVNKLSDSTWFLYSRPLSILANPKFKINSFLLTDSTAWGKTNFEMTNEPLKYNKNNDIMGPLTFGVTISGFYNYDKQSDKASAANNKKNNETRLVIIGDSDFVSNALLGTYDNGKDLFMNVIAWLTQQEKNITIRAKKARNIFLDPSGKRIIFIFSVIVFPLIIAGLGVYVYSKRKNR